MKKRIALVALLLVAVLCLAVACEIEQPKTYNVTYTCDIEGAISDKAFTYTEGADKVEIAVTLNAAYTQSTLTVTYTVGGGEAQTATLTDGKFTVEAPKGDITVNVSGAKLNEYKVDFVVGTEVKYTTNVKHGDTLTVPQLNSAKAAVAGTDGKKEFVKWTEDTDKAITADTVIHAELKDVTHNVKVMLGEVEKLTLTVVHGEKLTAEQLDQAKAAVTEAGYEFVKWTEAVDVEITADTVIHGETRRIGFAVRFKLGDEVKYETTVKNGQKLTAEQLAAAQAAVTETGYHFVSWSIADLADKVIDEDIDVVATVEINKYTVRVLVGDDVKATFENITHGSTLTDEQINQAKAAVVTDGYHWVSFDRDVTAAITSDTDIVATIAINTYNVAIKLDGETKKEYTVNHGATLTSEQIAEAEAAVKAAIDSEHRFDGWQTTIDGAITANTEIVAKVRDLYNFKVRLNGNVDDALVKTDVEVDNAVEDEEFTFSLEFTAAYTQSASKVTVTYTIGNGEAQTLTADQGIYTIAKVTGDVTITVTGIEINKYTVSFANGDEVKSTITVNHGDKVTAEQLATALETIANDNQETWGWKDETDVEITADTTMHAIVADAISTKEQMLAIKQEGSYYLTADIDMGDELAVVWGNVVWTADPETCGDAKNGEYRGIFDGRDKTLTYTHTTEVPYDMALLFYRLAGTVKNLKINATLNNAFKQGYTNTLGVVAMQLADGTIQNVEVTLNAGGMQNQPSVGVGAICSNFFGGTIDNCVVNFASLPTYNLGVDKVAPVAAVKSWEKADVKAERTKVLTNLFVHMPSNVNTIADYVTYLTMEALVGDYQPEIAQVEPTFDLAKDGEIIWESTDYKKAITESTEEQSAAPRGFEKVFKSDNTYDDNTQNVVKRFIVDENLVRYTKVAFALKTDNRNLCDSAWGNPLTKDTWYVFYAEKKDGKWTLTVHEKTVTGTVMFTYADLNVTSLADLYHYYNWGGEPTHIWTTEIRFVADPDYVEMVGTQLTDATLTDGTKSDTLTVDGYTAVYTRDSFSLSWNEIDISEYDYVTFKTDYRGYYLPNPSWNGAFDCSTWVEWTLTNKKDGTWIITFNHDGTSVDHVNTFNGAKLNEVLNIYFCSPKDGADGTFSVTNLIGYKAK